MPASVLCGEETCDLATHTCCLREFGASCIEGVNATCDLGGTPLICDGPEDCGGGSCCLGVGLPGALEVAQPHASTSRSATSTLTAQRTKCVDAASSLVLSSQSALGRNHPQPRAQL